MLDPWGCRPGPPWPRPGHFVRAEPSVNILPGLAALCTAQGPGMHVRRAQARRLGGYLEAFGARACVCVCGGVGWMIAPPGWPEGTEYPPPGRCESSDCNQCRSVGDDGPRCFLCGINIGDCPGAILLISVRAHCNDAGGNELGPEQHRYLCERHGLDMKDLVPVSKWPRTPPQ